MTKEKSIAKTLEIFCKEAGEKLTAPRRDVLQIIAAADHPLSAYDIMDAMTPRPKPPTVYRALQFLEENGFVHRIPSLQAYMLCAADHKHHDHGTQFLLCDKCHNVTEIHVCAMPPSLAEQATKLQFKSAAWTLEINGLCRDCVR